MGTWREVEVPTAGAPAGGWGPCRRRGALPAASRRQVAIGLATGGRPAP